LRTFEVVVPIVQLATAAFCVWFFWLADEGKAGYERNRRAFLLVMVIVNVLAAVVYLGRGLGLT
jgi:ABC-type transport system involved in cytochrome bd biosynthesis fused ATPase/permease subunit